MITWIMRRLRERSDRGAIAVVVALMASTLCVCGALAVDIGELSQLHNQAQTATDDAALSAASYVAGAPTSSNEPTAVTDAEHDMINTLGYTPSSWNTCSGAPSASFTSTVSTQNCVLFYGTAVWVGLPSETYTYLLGKAAKGVPAAVNINASSTASYAAGTSGSSPCALCLVSSTGRDLDDEGSSWYTVTGAALWDYSTNTSSSSPTYGSYVSSYSSQSYDITAPSIGVPNANTYYGAASNSYSATPAKPSVASWGTDPLASVLSPPAFYSSQAINTASYSGPSSGSMTLPASSNGNNQYGNVDANACSTCTLTIPPGNYNTITAEGSETLILQPGVYFISGSLNVQGHGILQEQPGVLLYFTCGSTTTVSTCTSAQKGGSYTTTGSGAMTWSPYTSGMYKNLGIYYDPNNTSPIVASGASSLACTNTDGTGNGSAAGTQSCFDFTIYAKSAQLQVSGSSAALSSLVVVGSAIATGNTGIIVNYQSGYNVGIGGTNPSVGLCVYGTNC